jgi:dTDP-4-dehydrorhamnose 3,5-epimerase
MHITDTAIADVKRITLDMFRDARGFFCERYSAPKLAALGFHEDFVQDNHSRSLPGVLRGLHLQHTPVQGKLVGVARGHIWDVAVDVRPHSPTFGTYVAEELSGDNGVMLWIPPGFAHGFCVLGNEEAEVIYKTTSPFAAEGEAGIRFDDAQLNIPWPIDAPLLSPRDTQLPTLAALHPHLLQWFPA